MAAAQGVGVVGARRALLRREHRGVEFVGLGVPAEAAESVRRLLPGGDGLAVVRAEGAGAFLGEAAELAQRVLRPGPAVGAAPTLWPPVSGAGPGRAPVVQLRVRPAEWSGGAKGATAPVALWPPVMVCAQAGSGRVVGRPGRATGAGGASGTRPVGSMEGCSPVRPTAMRRRRSWASAGRSSGVLARRSRTTRSKNPGSSARWERGGSGAVSRWPTRMPQESPRSKGGAPVAISYSTQPSE